MIKSMLLSNSKSSGHETGLSLKDAKYSRTSMAQTSFGPWKFVRDMGSSGHWGLIITPGQ